MGRERGAAGGGEYGGLGGRWGLTRSLWYRVMETVSEFGNGRGLVGKGG